MKFVDTSWWVAWSRTADGHHEQAQLLAGQLLGGEQGVTTNLVVGETWTYLDNRAGHGDAVHFLDRVALLEEGGNLVVHRVTEDQERKAWRWLRRHDERAYSFVHATSFQVMRDRRLREALAFDGDFAAAGFIELRP